MFGVANDFSQIFHNLHEMLCDSCLKILSHRDYLRPFLVWPPKSTSSVFLQMLGAIFWSQTTVDAIFEFLGFCQDISGFCPDISGFCPDFQGFCQKFLGFCPDIRQIKTFGGALAPPAPPSPTPLSTTYPCEYFFSVMTVSKWNHRATLKIEHLEELIRTDLTTYCPDFRGLENQTKTQCWQLRCII